MARYIDASKLIRSGDDELLVGQPDVSRWTGRRDRLAILLMLRCGLRVSECFLLRRSQVGMVRGVRVLRVREGKATVGTGKKTVRPRDIPCPPDVARALDDWLERDCLVESVYLLPTRSGRPVHRVDAAKMVKRYAEQAGIGHTHPHMLRHTYASQALRDGFTLPEVSHLLGHGSVQSTMVYLHPHLDVIADKMKEWDRGGSEE